MFYKVFTCTSYMNKINIRINFDLLKIYICMLAFNSLVSETEMCNRLCQLYGLKYVAHFFKKMRLSQILQQKSKLVS